MSKALDIAQHIIDFCCKEGQPISNLQLQKILYYVQLNFLVRGQTLFDDDFIAMDFGPAILEVYNLYCGFGGSKIIIHFPQEIDLPERIKAEIDPIIRTKRVLEPWSINEKLLRKNGPWELVYTAFGAYSVIPKDLIKKDYLGWL